MTHVGSSRDSPNESITAHSGAQVFNVRLNLGGNAVLYVVILTIVIGACGLVMGLNLAKQDQMDRDFKEASTRLMLNERRLMDKEAYAILNGEKIPGDDAHGPTGNLQRIAPKEKTDGRR